MPHFQIQTQTQTPPHSQSTTTTHVLDLHTAVKDGILDNGVVSECNIFPTTATTTTTTTTDCHKLDLNKLIQDLDPSENNEIPSVFICPISLDPMTDPVTLCTGHTYERANITKWLSLGTLTCPTTMQDLWDYTLTPNSTLAQLIHAWFSQKYIRMKKKSEDVNGRAAELLTSLKVIKGKRRVQALKDLRALVTTHASTRKVVVDQTSGSSVLSSLLGPFTSHVVGSEVIGILVNLELDFEAKVGLMQPAKISLVVDLVNEGTVETKVNCMRFLEMLMEEEDRGFRWEVIASMSLLVGVLRLVKDKRHPNGVLAGIGVLKTICGFREVRGLVVSVGAVAQIVELLPELGGLDCLEPALHVLEDLASVPEGQVALKDCSRTIHNVVRLLMRVSEACTTSALSILLAVFKLDPGECGKVAVEAGLAAKLLLVIQSGCDQALKQRASELLKLCSLNYTPNNFISKCKLTRTLQ